MLWLRGFAVESVVARICREGGGRVRTNIMLRDWDMELPHVGDARRVEVVVDGPPLYGGRQLAVDTTLVGVLHANGQPMRRTPDEDGVRLVAVRRRKERTYPELVGRRGRATLVVLAGEVGGRWSGETISFLNQLAKARARSESILMRKRVGQVGACGGRPCSLVSLPGLWLLPCWISVVLMVQMVRPLPPMKLTGSSGTLGWRDPGHLRRVRSVLLAFSFEFCHSVL